ncbi:centrosomal protein kizuna-like [Physella acuta]|uniref:centrosomal protein kizuna-like n=1 Tax=Physella acuta TaxID=109671 RepID=UPI0027DAC91F|nr:centrosomal protein kizuna-like [Physella acuta]
MASSNVKFYERQKELQDTISNCEQQRLTLEHQFRRSLQADQTSTKMKASRLYTYWRKVCEDERKAKQRNEMLLRDFQRIDSHMSELNARTQRLALMKKQYEDYIASTYPQWNTLMSGSSQNVQKTLSDDLLKPEVQKQMQPMPEKTNSPPPPSPIRPQAGSNHIKSGVETRQPGTPEHHIKKSTISHPQNQGSSHPQNEGSSHPQNQGSTKSHPQSQGSIKSQPQSQGSTSSQPQIQKSSEPQQTGQKFSQHTAEDVMIKSERKVQAKEIIYANLPSATKDSVVHHDTVEQKPHSPTHHITSAQSQPIKNLDVKYSGQMVPPEENLAEQDEEDSMEFMTESDLPMALSLGNTQVKADPQSEEQSSFKKFELSSTIKPELTVRGLLGLLKLMEADLEDAFSLEGYYRSSWPDTAQKNDIIRKANAGQDLSRVDANLISMVILEQLTLIARNLKDKCVLTESMLAGNLTDLSPSKLRQQLAADAVVVWDAVFHHFTQLVKAQALRPNELSAIFTPCLVSDGGSQDKAHHLLCHLLGEINTLPENPVTPRWSQSMISGQALEESNSFMEDGRVPPLKFGSLLDKPFSDDESSYMTSLPRDSVPLNETAAYKSMVSGHAANQPRHQNSLQEDTDDDVEKQIKATLTKKVSQPQQQKTVVEMDDFSETSSQTTTQQTTPHLYIPTAMTPRSATKQNLSRFGVRISSDLDTDTEVDIANLGSNKKEEDDFDFYD